MFFVFFLSIPVSQRLKAQPKEPNKPLPREMPLYLYFTGAINPTNPMPDLRQKLHQIAPSIFEDTPVLFAYLYGSYATGVSHPFSDLDIGIYVEGLDVKACLDLELSLALRIDQDLEHTLQTEVRILSHLPLAVIGSILSEAELIYSRNEDKRIEFETRVRTAYFDFLPVIRQYRKSYRERAVQSSGIH
jgi:predicted nucleotidyltransferase